ncbi:carbonic anhydrase [Dichomitus squalens LYAD-421 SS1]|uniref:Carbonic anhydrase n=1 Tax=Dichomitus squalens (strain LYAD-421) TaxID=732165 RepID=R7SZ28_DICSQ|nr:carbonic anhydrase [Dichomitus squalens LYAD-421 SS1]EJF61459.1 carbonic anhydrase [Dichomitus squalens LYAD-421 SS1]
MTSTFLPSPPSKILSDLLNRNEKWTEANSGLFLQETQSPKVLWIGCADSRVPESVITNLEPGMIFTHRNIANQFHADDDNAISVLIYAVENPKMRVDHIIVVGHTRCGGVEACCKAAQADDSPPANALQRWLAPLTEFARNNGLGGDLSALLEANVRMQVDNVLKSEVLEREWGIRDVHVHG